MDFTGKTVLISGAASGIGAETARQIVERGGRVVIGDVAAAGADTAKKLGERASYVWLDVTDGASWNAAVAHTLETFGTLDGLVNNAGIPPHPVPLADTDADHFRRLVEVDLTGVFLGLKAAVLHFRTHGGGSIVNISSAAGLKGLPVTSGYGAAKWGVRGMTKTAAVEEGCNKIRVNSVHPGMVATAMTEGALAPGAGNFPGAPLEARVADPSEIAAAVVFLLSDAASYMTGAELAVDGGWTVA